MKLSKWGMIREEFTHKRFKLSMLTASSHTQDFEKKWK